MSTSTKLGCVHSVMTILLGGVKGEERYLIARQDLVDLAVMVGDPAVECFLPRLLAEANAHRDLVIEADLRVRLEWQSDPRVGAFVATGVSTREEARDGPPYDGYVDRVMGEVALDDARRVLA